MRSLGHQVMSGKWRAKCDHVLAGAAAGLDHIAGFAGEKLLQNRPDRLMVAVKCRRIETAVGLDRPAILAEFHDKFGHAVLATRPVAIRAYPL